MIGRHRKDAGRVWKVGLFPGAPQYGNSITEVPTEWPPDRLGGGVVHGHTTLRGGKEGDQRGRGKGGRWKGEKDRTKRHRPKGCR